MIKITLNFLFSIKTKNNLFDYELDKYFPNLTKFVSWQKTL